MPKSTSKPVVVIPNLNGADSLRACLDSLLAQTLQPHIIVVDNGSVDDSVALVHQYYPSVELIRHTVNKGYAGGVNPGLRRAIELGCAYAAPFNNDAVADRQWLHKLVQLLDTRPDAGAAACKVLAADGEHLDSTGDYYTTWGLPYPRGRGEKDTGRYDAETDIFAASGAASLYRLVALQEVGLFDEDFFAYYEDVDLSFRLQLAGWKVVFEPAATVSHATGSTSSKMKGFTTYQTMKNLPLLLVKNVPGRYLWSVGCRFLIAHTLFFGRAVSRGQGEAALKGSLKGIWLLFGAFAKRGHIQSTKKVSDKYIWGIMTHDLPPNARALRGLRARWWKLTGAKAAL